MGKHTKFKYPQTRGWIITRRLGVYYIPSPNTSRWGVTRLYKRKMLVIDLGRFCIVRTKGYDL